jgi:Domain of unknown function (DUF4873)
VRIGGEYAGPAVICSQAWHVSVAVHLVIEVDELDVDGQLTDGYRTWVGRITTGGDADTSVLTSAQDLRIELPGGRRASCLVVDDLRIVGLGPPPFD